MATQGGPATGVVVQSGGRQVGGPALPVAVQPAGSQVEDGNAMLVYIVTSGQVQGGPAVPIVPVSAASHVEGGAAQPVYVVSGYLPSPEGQKVLDLGPIAYWPLDEASGTVAIDRSGNNRNGAYTNVTLGAAGIGDGRTAASFDGATSFCNLYSASLAGAFSGVEGTIALWGKISGAGVWSDGTTDFLAALTADANNRVTISKALNSISVNYRVAGVNNLRTISTTTVNWFHIACTWSKSGNAAIVYFNGVQQGATFSGFGTWAGNLGNTTTVLGDDSTTPDVVWSGALAHAALWAAPLSATQIANLAVIP